MFGRRQVSRAQSLPSLPLFRPSLLFLCMLPLLTCPVWSCCCHWTSLSCLRERCFSLSRPRPRPRQREASINTRFGSLHPAPSVRDPQPPGARERVRSSKKRLAAPLGFPMWREGMSRQGGTEGIRLTSPPAGKGDFLVESKRANLVETSTSSRQHVFRERSSSYCCHSEQIPSLLFLCDPGRTLGVPSFPLLSPPSCQLPPRSPLSSKQSRARRSVGLYLASEFLNSGQRSTQTGEGTRPCGSISLAVGSTRSDSQTRV